MGRGDLLSRGSQIRNEQDGNPSIPASSQEYPDSVLQAEDRQSILMRNPVVTLLRYGPSASVSPKELVSFTGGGKVTHTRTKAGLHFPFTPVT